MFRVHGFLLFCWRGFAIRAKPIILFLHQDMFFLSPIANRRQHLNYLRWRGFVIRANSNLNSPLARICNPCQTNYFISSSGYVLSVPDCKSAPAFKLSLFSSLRISPCSSSNHSYLGFWGPSFLNQIANKIPEKNPSICDSQETFS